MMHTFTTLPLQPLFLKKTTALHTRILTTTAIYPCPTITQDLNSRGYVYGYGYGSGSFLARLGNSKLKLHRSSNNPTAVPVATSIELESAADVVLKFYDGINARDLGSVEGLISNNCVYEDLVFPQPFVGRKAILEFFNKFMDSISKDLQFVIDDISQEDTSAVGVTWHLEWKGKPFPFSKGCSFYRLEVVDGRRQIVYGRDVVEPAIKPGETALAAIRGVTWLLQKFPFLAERL